jgi:putative transposase
LKGRGFSRAARLTRKTGALAPEKRMYPKRETATNNGQTYFVSSSTAQPKPFFRHERWATLFLEILQSYRPERYLLHAFVLMPDHFHVVISPKAGLELAVQCIKGGFSFRAKREFHWRGDIWATGFSDHRVRDSHDLESHLGYIANNPVKARLVENAAEYPFSNANGHFQLDAFPPGLKPLDSQVTRGGAAEAAPFQNKILDGRPLGGVR